MTLPEKPASTTEGEVPGRLSVVQALLGSSVFATLFGAEANVAVAKGGKHNNRKGNHRKKNKKNRENPANIAGCIGCAVGDVCVEGVCCTPEGKVWCAKDGRLCGKWADNCNLVIDCGTCPTGQYCIDWSGTCSTTPPCPTSTCPTGTICVDGGCCTPDPLATCQGVGQECGYMYDNCNQKLFCGTCAPGLICDFETAKCVDQYLCSNVCGGNCCADEMLCVAGECADDDNPPPMYVDQKPFGQTSSLRPTISVVMADDTQLASSNITMLVDGQSRPFSYDMNTGVISWTPGSNLAAGTHNVKVTTKDLGRPDLGAPPKVAELEWQFSIVAKPDITKPVITSIDSKIVSGKRTRTILIGASDPESGIFRVEARFCKTPTSNAQTCWDSGNWLKSPNGFSYNAPYEVSGNNIPSTGTYWVVIRAVNNAQLSTLLMRRFTWTSSGFTPDTGLVS